MISTRALDSGDLSVAWVHFLGDLRDWIASCLEEFGEAPPTDGHDQGTFTAAWEPLIEAQEAGGTGALEFMTDLRDKVAKHFTECGRWKHGYWTIADVHHGTEHFELFLGCLHRLRPDDGETVGQLIDAAEHVGNWVEGIPAWFDWDTGLFRGLHLGTQEIRPAEGAEFNLPDHFRCINISLLAWQATGEGRYLELARAHGGRWADAVLARDDLPVAIDAKGPRYRLAEKAEGAYRAFVGQVGRLQPEVDRAENFLASGAVNALLALWQATEEVRYRQAAERLLDVLAGQLSDPDAGAVADALRTYRRRTGDTRFDQKVLGAMQSLEPFSFRELSIEPTVQRQGRPSGIGKRADMPAWYEDGRARRHNPILLATAAEITDDEVLATRAMDLGRAYFRLARRAYPHGREHGCSARSVSAIARGHGRDNNAGVVTAVLGPLQEAFERSI